MKKIAREDPKPEEMEPVDNTILILMKVFLLIIVLVFLGTIIWLIDATTC